MKLLTKELAKKIPALYSQENDPDPTVWVKFFNPGGPGSWFVLEFDGEDQFFGWVNILGDDDAELGYFSLAELAEYKGRFGLGIERDLFWKPTPLSKVKAGEVR
jgi:hypothetical protein